MADEASEFIPDPTTFVALSKIHKKPVLDCCFSPDTNQIVTASEDDTVVLWDLPPIDTELHDETLNDEHKLYCWRLSDHKSPVMSVAMHKRLLVTVSKDGKAKLWRLMPGSMSSGTAGTSSRINSTRHSQFKRAYPEPTTYSCHTRIARSVCFSPNADRFATGSDDMSIKIWSTECRNKLLMSLLDGHRNWVRSVRWAKTNDQLIASCGDDGRICIWDSRFSGRQAPCETIQTRRRVQFNCLDWHPVFEHHIATGAQDSSCVVWDLRNRKQVQVYLEHDGSVNSISFNSGGSLLLTGSNDQTSKIFDVCEGRNMFTLASHSKPVTSVCFSSNDDLFATGSQDKTVTVWKRNFETVNIVLAPS